MRSLGLAALLLCGDALAQPWTNERSTPSRVDRDPPERVERDYDRESSFPRRESSPAPARAAEKTRAPAQSPWTAGEARDPDLARCDRYRAQLETLLREEMRGHATGAQQRTLHEARMRDGC